MSTVSQTVDSKVYNTGISKAAMYSQMNGRCRANIPPVQIQMEVFQDTFLSIHPRIPITCPAILTTHGAFSRYIFLNVRHRASSHPHTLPLEEAGVRDRQRAPAHAAPAGCVALALDLDRGVDCVLDEVRANAVPDLFHIRAAHGYDVQCA